jgi:hypothetical protein
MLPQGSATGFFTKLERVISAPRFEAYRRSGETREEALCKYLWNIKLCEALYPALQVLEVGFRNALHTQIGIATKTPDWLKERLSIIYADELAHIDRAEATLRDRGKTVTEAYLVSEMRFGFWTSILDGRYERLWHRIIKDVFPNMPRHVRTRGDASVVMNKVRRLRNAALHHHSIWHWTDLQDQHKSIHLLLGWICESLSRVAVSVDRFPDIHAAGHGSLMATVEKYSN